MRTPGISVAVQPLRGQPTPTGAALNVSGRLFKDGNCSDTKTLENLEMVDPDVVNSQSVANETGVAGLEPPQG